MKKIIRRLRFMFTKICRHRFSPRELHLKHTDAIQCKICGERLSDILVNDFRVV